MKISILATQTGNGHVSVMNSLYAEFLNHKDIEVQCFPEFYENLCISNKILSGFYNFLMVNSTQLCAQYCEYTFMTRPDLSTDFYEAVHDEIVKFIQENDADLYLSVSHTINYVFLKVLKELGSEAKYSIVVTDPFEPISVGFAVPGATRYYCASHYAKQALLRGKIPESQICVSGFPVHPNYKLTNNREEIAAKFELDSKQKIVLLNSGSQGSFYYFDILKQLNPKEQTYQVIFLCGKNKNLFMMANRYVKKNDLYRQVKVLEFTTDMHELLEVADVVITKPGANSFYECLAMKSNLIIDAVNGFLFQEKGVKTFIEEYKVAEILYDIKDANRLVEFMCDSEHNAVYKQNIEELQLDNSAETIVQDILCQ